MKLSVSYVSNVVQCFWVLRGPQYDVVCPMGKRILGVVPAERGPCLSHASSLRSVLMPDKFAWCWFEWLWFKMSLSLFPKIGGRGRLMKQALGDLAGLISQAWEAKELFSVFFFFFLSLLSARLVLQNTLGCGGGRWRGSDRWGEINASVNQCFHFVRKSLKRWGKGEGRAKGRRN